MLRRFACLPSELGVARLERRQYDYLMDYIYEAMVPCSVPTYLKSVITHHARTVSVSTAPA